MRKKNNSTKGDKFADFMDFNKPHMNDQRLLFFFAHSLPVSAYVI